jgi:hypothetical protein
MPKGPKGERRPTDVIGNAIKVGRIAVGDEEEELEPKKAPMTAQEMGKVGGATRAKNLSAKKRSEIAKKAAKQRWAARPKDQ